MEERMKKVLWILGVVIVLALSSSAFAICPVYLYVDAAPNKFGSPNYSAWEANAYALASTNSFVNMASSINPLNVGSKNFEIQDEVVYSFGDLGKRLTFVYWLPNTTVAALTGNFSISLLNNWGGTSSDFYLDYYGQTWLQPTTWMNYNGGVIGTAGMAWWGGYNTNTQAELDADLAAWGSVPESWTFQTQLGSQICSITATRDGLAPVPEPTTIALFGVGLLGVGFLARRRKK
jgi:hypothetical protein